MYSLQDHDSPIPNVFEPSLKVLVFSSGIPTEGEGTKYEITSRAHGKSIVSSYQAQWEDIIKQGAPQDNRNDVKFLRLGSMPPAHAFENSLEIERQGNLSP